MKRPSKDKKMRDKGIRRELHRRDSRKNNYYLVKIENNTIGMIFNKEGILISLNKTFKYYNFHQKIGNSLK